jgi:preprotein translocase subunit SecA
MKPSEIEEKLIELAEALYEEREKELGSDNMRDVEKRVMLHYIDSLWVEHLTAMERMREGIGLQAVGQRDPLVAYKTEGHNQFQNLLSAIQHYVVHTIYHVKIERRGAPEAAPSPMAKAAVNRGDVSKQKPKVGGKKIGRNDPCPCGSGKKYKHCCGR